MTVTEFQAWKKETDRSVAAWVVDRVMSHNQKCCFIYRGGENGNYVRVDSSGLVELGTYEGAIPHIGEALFKKTGEVQCEGYDNGVLRICTALNIYLESMFIF